MIIEHIGLAVAEPHAMADWYVENLGFVIRFKGGSGNDQVAFVSDPDQDVMLELLLNPKTPPMDWVPFAPLTMHIAVNSADPAADAARLVNAGATLIDPTAKIPTLGNILLLLRDPWGQVIQLVKREKAL